MPIVLAVVLVLLAVVIIATNNPSLCLHRLWKNHVNEGLPLLLAYFGKSLEHFTRSVILL